VQGPAQWAVYLTGSTLLMRMLLALVKVVGRKATRLVVPLCSERVACGEVTPVSGAA
jgi:hypothetical protein